MACACCGIVGSFGTAAYVSYTKKFRCTSLFISALTVFACAAFAFTLPFESFALTGLSCALIAVFADGMLSFGLEFACEASYPAPPNRASGVVLAYSHLLSTVIILAASYMVPDPNDASYDEYNSVYVCVLLMFCFLVGFICTICSREDLRKTKIDLGQISAC